MKKPLIVIAGPTAVGKTKTSIELAKKLNGEIISADSMQVYKYMDIGTAKPTVEEMQGITHYLIDEFYPDDEFNVAIFKRKAKEYIDKIYSKGKIPIIVGGTGFYIQSIIYDINFEDTDTDEQYRSELTQLAIDKGNDYVHDMLREVDPVSADAIHKNNLKRVIRALEYHKQTGETISSHNEREKQRETPYNLGFFVLNMDRERLYERIDLRVDIMIEQGLFDEVKSLLDKGYTKDLVSMKGLGYKEIIDYYEGNITKEEAIYILKRDTRHFAKRQLTWFKRERDVNWVDVGELGLDIEKIKRNIENHLEQCGIML